MQLASLDLALLAPQKAQSSCRTAVAAAASTSTRAWAPRVGWQRAAPTYEPFVRLPLFLSLSNWLLCLFSRLQGGGFFPLVLSLAFSPPEESLCFPNARDPHFVTSFCLPFWILVLLFTNVPPFLDPQEFSVPRQLWKPPTPRTITSHKTDVPLSPPFTSLTSISLPLSMAWK